MPPKLGVLAGGGDLPVRIIEACRRTGRPYFVVAFEGQTPAGTVAGTPHSWVRLGAPGKALKLLREQRVEELVLAGSVRRPSVAEVRPDLWAAKFLAKVGSKALGDDGLLQALVRELEEKEGFRVVGAETLLPGTLAEEGVFGRIAPDAQARQDIERGIEVAHGLCEFDVGQAVVVQQGLVLAVEAIEGTDAMVARAGRLQRGGAKGVLVKVGQPKRESRADLPTIGVGTVRAVAGAGLQGIAVEANGALVLDRESVVRAADAAGVFVVGVAVRTGSP